MNIKQRQDKYKRMVKEGLITPDDDYMDNKLFAVSISNVHPDSRHLQPMPSKQMSHFIGGESDFLYLGPNDSETVKKFNFLWQAKGDAEVLAALKKAEPLVEKPEKPAKDTVDQDDLNAVLAELARLKSKLAEADADKKADALAEAKAKKPAEEPAASDEKPEANQKKGVK